MNGHGNQILAVMISLRTVSADMCAKPIIRSSSRHVLSSCRSFRVLQGGWVCALPGQFRVVQGGEGMLGM